MSASAESTPTGEAKSDSRPFVRAAFLVFVCAQVLVPLSYYGRDDRYDERFAWRMFSSVRVVACTPIATEVDGGETRALSLTKVIHYAWIEHFARNRRRVIDRFLALRCESTRVSEVAITNHCRDAGGDAIAPIVRRRVCATGEVRSR